MDDCLNKSHPQLLLQPFCDFHLMNARYALIPILGASALLLSGCFSTLQPAVAPQSSTTDPIAEAQYIQYNTSTRANALIINIGTK